MPVRAWMFSKRLWGCNAAHAAGLSRLPQRTWVRGGAGPRGVASNVGGHVHHQAAAACDQEAPAQPPRFYVSEQLQGQPPGWLVRLDSTESRHFKTLRLQEGTWVELCDGRGSVVLAEIAGLGRDGALARTLAEATQVALHGWQWQVAVACGSLKGGRADWLVEKSVELGAADFIPLLTQRSPAIGSSGGGIAGGSSGSRGSSGKQGRRHDQKKKRGSRQLEEHEEEPAGWQGGPTDSGREGRWQRLAIAALKQSLRAHAMRVHAPCDIQALCRHIGAAEATLVGVAGATPLHEAAAALRQRQHAGQGDKGALGQHSRTTQQRATNDSAERAQQGNGGPGNSAGQVSSAEEPSPLVLRQGLLVIGPEGDFTPEELEQLLAAGATPVGLGDLRLRAETAAIALLAYVRLQLV